MTTRPCRILFWLPVAIAILAPALAPAADDDARWSPEGRKSFVETVQWLESHPMDGGQRTKEALRWIVEVPDVTLTWCSHLLMDATNKKARQIAVVQGTLAAGAFLVQHPEMAQDMRSSALAGVTSALATYRIALAADPSYRDALYDSLAAGGTGAVDAYVDQKLRECEEAESKKKKR